MEVQKNKAHFSLHKSNVFLLVCFSPCKTSCSWQSPVWCCCWAARNWSWFHPHRRPPHQNSYCWIFLHRQEGGAAERERKCQTFPSCKLILPICRHIYSQLCGVWPGMIFCNFPNISLPHDVGFCVFKAHTHSTTVAAVPFPILQCHSLSGQEGSRSNKMSQPPCCECLKTSLERNW